MTCSELEQVSRTRVAAILGGGVVALPVANNLSVAARDNARAPARPRAPATVDCRSETN